MKALVYQGAKNVQVLDNIRQPPLSEGQARVRVIYCGICGSDIGIYRGSHPRAKAPLILGHEFVGIVESVKGPSHGIKPGTRVASYPLMSCGTCYACQTGIPHVCESLRILGIDRNGGIAEYVDCDISSLFKVDDSVSDIAAACIEPLAVAIHSIHRSGFKPMDSTLILGAGPIGILIGLVLMRSGASRVIISDINEARLAFCRELGLETADPENGSSVRDYVFASTDKVGVDIVFECAGVESTAKEMTYPLRIDGMVCLVGVHKGLTEVALSDMHFRELRMVATRVYTKHEFGQAVKYAAVLSDEMERMARPILPLSESHEIFSLIRNPDICSIKPLIRCS